MQCNGDGPRRPLQCRRQGGSVCSFGAVEGTPSRGRHRERRGRDGRARPRRRFDGPGARARDAERTTNGEGMRRDGQARPRGRRDGPGAVHVRDLAWPTIRGKDA